MSKSTAWLVMVAAALIAAVCGFWLARDLDSAAPQLASGTWLSSARRLPDFTLTDQAGKPFTAQNLKGKPTLVFFGFTRCPDVCPTTLVKLAQVKKAAALPALQVLFISVDPERDTPTALSLYVHAFDPTFIGATGTPAALEKITAAFSVAYAKVPLPGGDYTMDHSAAVFLLNERGEIAAIFTPPFDPRTMAGDLKVADPYLTARS